MTSIQPKVALSQDFLLTLSRLPAAIHSKVLKWTVQFQTNPTSSAINYEKILEARDPNLKSVRIDQDYRGIVFKPQKDDVYVLLHVDHHDAAYRWAARKQIKVHPVTGAMQLVQLEEVTEHEERPEATPATEQSPEAARPLFSHLTHDDMLSFGIPEELFAQVDGVTSTSALAELRPLVDVAAYEALALLADGFTLSEVREDIEARRNSDVDTTDFAASLETPESRSSFYIVEGEAELISVLNSPLAQWRIFLHPKQRRLATCDANGPMRVLGGAGTGKTVLAMHRAKWLAENRTEAEQKVLVTTFTRNLAGDIEANLKTLCSRETMNKIEVTNLDAWVRKYLASKSYELRIQYDISGEAKAAWDIAMTVRNTDLALPDDFYETEWEQVVAANGISTLDEYRQARRTGRGGVLQRKLRDAVWPVFEEFRAELTRRKLKMVDDAYRDAAALLANDDRRPSYSAIVVDETQDFGPMALRLLRQIVPPGKNDLCFVGDGHQRIYKRNRAAMSRCGISIVGRSHKLYLNYRTTDQIRRFATALLEGYPIDDLDDGNDTNRGYTSLSFGPMPDVLRVDNRDRALDAVLASLREWTLAHAHERLTQCVIVPKLGIREDLARKLEREGEPVRLIDADNRDRPELSGVRLTTMHRSKGLEFDRVIVVIPRSTLDGPDPDETDRKLLYVALTRARREAGIVAYEG